MRRVSAVRWLDRLRGDDVEVRINAEPVAIHLQGEGLLRRCHRILLLPPLLREDPQGGEVVLHLLETRSAPSAGEPCEGDEEGARRCVANAPCPFARHPHVELLRNRSAHDSHGRSFFWINAGTPTANLAHGPAQRVWLPPLSVARCRNLWPLSSTHM